MKSILEWLKDFKIISSAIVGAVGVAAAVYGTVTWFQPRAEAGVEHDAIRMQLREFAQLQANDSFRQNLEAELERVKLGIKMLNSIVERRVLTPDESTELAYLIERRNQITERLYNSG